MDDPVTMKVVKSLYELLSDLADFRLSQVSVVLKDLEELTLGEFSDDTELVGCFERIEQQNDVFMVQTFQNFDFLSQIVALKFITKR